MSNADGIPAKYDGKCEFDCLYGGAYEKGHLIDRVSRDSKKWGHTQCVREWVAAHGNVEPGGARPAASAPAPSTNGNGHANGNGTTLSERVENFPNGRVSEALFTLADTLSAISQTILASAIALKKLADAIDPHQVTRTPR